MYFNIIQNEVKKDIPFLFSIKTALEVGTISFGFPLHRNYFFMVVFSILVSLLTAIIWEHNC